MDAGLTIRPTVNVADSALVRAEPAPVRASVATTLAPAKSVTASADVARLQAHDSALQSQQQLVQQQAQMRREVVIDAQTREVIFRVIDVRSGQVDHQVPDEALLRLRAYNRTLAHGGETPSEGDGSTDTEA